MHARPKLVTTLVWFLWVLLHRKCNLTVLNFGACEGRHPIVCLFVYDWKCHFHLLNRFCMGTPTSVQKNVSQDTRHCNQSLFTVSPVNFIFYHCRCRYGKTRQIRGLFVFNCVAMVCIVLVLSELHSVRPADCQKLLFKVSVVGFHIGLEFHIDSEFFKRVRISHGFGIFLTSSDFTSIQNFSNEFGFHIDSEFFQTRSDFKRVRISSKQHFTTSNVYM